MRKFGAIFSGASLVFAASCSSIVPAQAQSAPANATVVSTCGTPVGAAYVAGTVRSQTQDTTGTLCTAGGGGGGGNVNLTGINGVTPLVGAGASGTGSLRTTQSQDTSTIAGSAPGTAGTPSANVVSVQGVGSGTPVVVNQTQINGNAVSTGSGTSGTGTQRITEAAAAPTSASALAANTVVCGAACQLTSFNVSADSTLSGAAWWVMIYNATSAPADGAVTPIKCFAATSGTTSLNGAFTAPLNLSTGAVIGVSTTGCFTKTASTHAFISGDSR